VPMRLPLRAVTRCLSGAAMLVLATGACGGGSGGSGGGGSGGAPTSMNLASVTPSPVTAAQSSPPGAFAADYLRDAFFTSLVIEVDYPADRPPEAAALALLETRLEERCNKPAGITIVLDDALPPGTFGTVVTAADIAAIEDANRSTYSNLSTGTAALYLVYVHGKSDLDVGSSVVIGVAYRGGSCAVYADRVDEGDSPPLVTTAEIEGATLVHEIGHLLALVNGGVPMLVPHEDPQSPFHDVDEDCVMYFQLQISLLGPDIGDPLFAQFDVRCMEDLAAFGGRPVTVLPKPGGPGTAAPTTPGPRVVVGMCGCASCLGRLAAQRPVR
jgi:hypothetical protein